MEIRNKLTVTRGERVRGLWWKEESRNMYKGHMGKDNGGGGLNVEDGVGGQRTVMGGNEDNCN